MQLIYINSEIGPLPDEQRLLLDAIPDEIRRRYGIYIGELGEYRTLAFQARDVFFQLPIDERMKIKDQDIYIEINTPRATAILSKIYFDINLTIYTPKPLYNGK